MPSDFNDFTALRIEISTGEDDDHQGLKLGVDGDIFWRIHITPQGQILVGDGTAPPEPFVGGGSGTMDHSELDNLAADDHTQYALADGSRGDFEVAGAAAAVASDLADHEIAADPHPQYTTAAELSTAITNAINALLDGAPAALDTLNELAAAVNDDASFAATVTTALALKANTADLGDLALLDQVTVADIDATGTPDGTTFLRGDGTWNAPAGSGGGLVDTDGEAGDTIFSGDTTPGAPTNGDLWYDADDDGVQSAAGVTYDPTGNTVLAGDDVQEVLDEVDVALADLPSTYMQVYTHNGTNYGLAGGRTFVGPEDPVADGFTMADGDQWIEV